MQGSHHTIVAGIDVSKATLDYAINSSTHTHRKVGYDPKGLKTLIDDCRHANVTLVVLEATGGLEYQLVHTLDHANLPFHIANPRQVRDLARAMGKLAKTDAIDARVLVDYGIKMQPAPQHLPDQNRQKLRALAMRHQQLSDMRTAELNRMDPCHDQDIQRMIRQHLASIEQQIRLVARQMEQCIDHDPDLQRQARTIESTPGVGRLTARRLVAQLPELGQRSPRQLAKLLGLAPVNRDSGTLRGKRTTGGGRSSLRKILYMPTLVATRYNPRIKKIYTQMVNAGKPKMVALVACMRKLIIYLNAMIRENKSWAQFNNLA